MKLFYRFVNFGLKFYFHVFHKHKTFGLEHLPDGACIIAPNHASFYDPPIISISSPQEVYFLAKKDLFKNFFFGMIIRNLNALPVTGTINDLSSFKMICRVLQENKKIVVFPEGIRTTDGKLSSIKSGIGMLALRNNCPIIPTYIHGTFDIWSKHKRFPLFKGQTACVFGEAIYPLAYKNMEKKIAQEIISIKVETSLINLQKKYEEEFLNN